VSKISRGTISMTLSRRRFLSNTALTAAAFALHNGPLHAAATDAQIDVLPGEIIAPIAPELYSHFLEQLGGVIYDGVWVGEDSKIANDHGIRRRFLESMRAIQAPVIRWPGGCFADSYDWRDAIGRPASRPNRSAFWSQQDSNHFGTHEFMAVCRATGAQPYLAANVRSGTARDFNQWVEYCNAPENSGSSLARERAANGSPEPFNVRYWGVGNEAWGCGGDMTPEEYAAEYRRFVAWMPEHFNNGTATELRLIACGPDGDKTDWTRRMMHSVLKDAPGRQPWGLSTHYYTSGSATQFAGGDAVKFTDDEYYDLLARAGIMEEIVTDHWAVLAESDPQHKTRLVIDEWGAWYGKSTMLGPQYNLSQQLTLRDALLTGITLDIFQRHADKIAMANVAQTINCLHSLMLARGDQFVTTPVFNVFAMYAAHRGGQGVRAVFNTPSIANPLAGGSPQAGIVNAQHQLAGLSGSASLHGKQLVLTVVNPHIGRPITTEIIVRDATITAGEGSVLTNPDIHAHNDFDNPNAVTTAAAVVKTGGKTMTHTFPPASVTALTLTLA
jgi:alpha-N-arabinofuranosidase